MTKSSTLSLHLCNSLYQEIVVDGPPSPDKQGVINFIRVLEWRLSNTITDEEFTHLYKIWVSSQNQLGKHKDPLSKKEMRELLHNKTELELLGMLGLLVRENNYSLLQSGHSAAWCKAIESLFWSIDHSGRGYATIDEILFLLLAIVGNPTESEEGNNNSNKVTVGIVQQHTFQLMKEFQASNGIVTLRHFKSYFHRNNLDLEAVHRSINSLSTLLSSISSGQPPEYQIAVPKLWEQAIYQAIDFIHESFAQSEDANAWGVVDFLSADAFELRFGFNSEKPHWKLSLLLFKEFTMMYGYVSPIEYTKDSIFNDQNFMLIQHTLRFYDELLTEILEKLFPSNDNSNIIEPVEPQSESVPYNEEDPPEKLALGEYTPEQVTRWLASAEWVDVLVNTEHDINVLSPYGGASRSTVLDYVDTDIPSQVEHVTPAPVDNLPKSQGNTKSGMFNSGIAVENITPTYLQSIFNTTPKSKPQPVIQKPTKKSSKVAAPPLQGDLLPDTKIVPIGVVPISKIPHKENMKGKKR